MAPAQHCLDPGHQFLGIKGLDHVVVSPQLQPQDLVKDLALGGQHDNGNLGRGPQLPAHLVSVHAGKHQIKKDNVGIKFGKHPESLLPVIYDQGFITFFYKIERDQLRDIDIIVNNEHPLFFCHFNTSPIT